MNWLHEYVIKIEELIEKPRNELRYKVATGNGEEYQELLKKYEDAYMEKCLKIEKYLDEEMKCLKGYKPGD
jgi:hypothetical protein